jgi:hypothetical protein
MTNQKLTDGEADFRRLIEIDAYLTEAKLAKVLREIVPDGWLGDQVQVVGSRFRWDIVYPWDMRFGYPWQCRCVRSRAGSTRIHVTCYVT